MEDKSLLAAEIYSTQIPNFVIWGGGDKVDLYCLILSRVLLMQRNLKIQCVSKKMFPLFSIIGHPLSKVVILQRLSSINSCLPSKVIIHQSLFSIKGHLPSKVVFHQKLSSIKSCLPTKFIFHQRSSFIKGHLPLKVVFHQMSFSFEGPVHV